MKTYRLKIEGMSCDSCSNRVQKALLKIPGVHDASASVSTKAGYVAADESVSFDLIKKTITDLGFQVVD